MSDGSIDSPQRIPMRRMILRAAVLFLVMLLFPFPIAGDWGWSGAWASGGLMIVFFAASRALAWRKNPDLLYERGRFLANEDIKAWDRILSVFVGLAGYVATMVVAALDLRLGWEPEVAFPLVLVGALLVVLGDAFASWAFLANRFFSGVVRIQKERGHRVVDSGPYRIVRHPGYLGGLLADAGAPLLLGSYWALIPAAVMIAALVLRTYLEDKTLQAELDGYHEYAERTRYRLVPGLW